MARKVFISILGIGYYHKTNYYTDNKDNSITTRFVQEAALKLLADDFTENDTAFIFLTEKAESQNWNSPAQSQHKGVIAGNMQTYTGLNEILSNQNFKFPIKSVAIANGDNEAEIWSIFQSVFESLQDGDELYFDITHAFRSIPMLVMVLINYAKFLKNITVKSITYGNWESRDKDNFSPIVDVTSFSLLQDWTNAADIFVNFGNASRINDLTKETNLNQTAKKMQKIMRFFSTVRGLKIIKGQEISKLKAEIKKIKEVIEKDSSNAPLIPLIQHLEKALIKFKQNKIINGFHAVKLCIDNELIQQSYTLLQEMILSYILEREEKKHDKKMYRNILSACLQVDRDEYTSRVISTKDKDKEQSLLDLFYNSFTVEAFKDIYNCLTDPRNDLNHAGIKGNSLDGADFLSIIIGLYNETIDVINQLENNKLLDECNNSEPEIFYKHQLAYYELENKRMEKKFEMTYPKWEEKTFGGETHSWEDEKIMQRWETIEAEMNFYKDKLMK